MITSNICLSIKGITELETWYNNFGICQETIWCKFLFLMPSIATLRITNSTYVASRHCQITVYSITIFHYEPENGTRRFLEAKMHQTKHYWLFLWKLVTLISDHSCIAGHIVTPKHNSLFVFVQCCRVKISRSARE
jgi:hypothetical protein